MCGIYFLKKGDEVVYVGQSIHVNYRVHEHSYTDKEFDSYDYIPCPKELLNCTEEAYILMYSPKYNIKVATIKTGNEEKLTQLYISNELHHSVRRESLLYGGTIKSVVENAIKMYLDFKESERILNKGQK